MYFEQKYRIAVWIVSGSAGVSIMLMPFLLGLYTPQKPYLIPLSQNVNNIMTLGLITALIFPAVAEFNNYRWGRQVDRHLPRLLRDIADAVRSGISLPRALEEASQRDYGPISKELERTASMFILAGRWDDSLVSLAQRLKRPAVLRFSTILIEAHQTGGKMIEVLDTSVDLFSSLNEYSEEQYNNMRPYTMTVYLAVVIFLIIARVVLHQFLGPLYVASTSVAAEESGFLTGVLDINYYTSILFWASNLESIFGGLIAGKIGEKTLSAGLLHAVVLTAVTLVFFNIG